MPSRKKPVSAPPSPPQTVEVVDPRWLLKALAGVFLFAVLCAYMANWLLFSIGQWHFALNPTHEIKRTPQALSLAFEPLRFGVDATGTPQLSGWYLPSDSSNDPVALVLHAGNGNMSDALEEAQILHTARLSVLLFDYRGFGASAGPHPTQLNMQDDAAKALDYLVVTRNISPSRIIPVGIGLGASLAVQLAAQHHEFPAVILDSPDGDLEARVKKDPRTRYVPVHWLLKERFPLEAPLHELATPKLIVSHGHEAVPFDAKQAANPKMTVELPEEDPTAYLTSLRRFLDQYVVRPVPTLQP